MMFIGHLKKLLHYCFDYRTIMAGNANLSCIHLIQLTCENIGYPISPTMPNGTGLETGTTLCLNILDSLFHLTSMSGACKHIECIGNIKSGKLLDYCAGSQMQKLFSSTLYFFSSSTPGVCCSGVGSLITELIYTTVGEDTRFGCTVECAPIMAQKL